MTVVVAKDALALTGVPAVRAGGGSSVGGEQLSLEGLQVCQAGVDPGKALLQNGAQRLPDLGAGVAVGDEQQLGDRRLGRGELAYCRPVGPKMRIWPAKFPVQPVQSASLPSAAMASVWSLSKRWA